MNKKLVVLTIIVVLIIVPTFLLYYYFLSPTYDITLQLERAGMCGEFGKAKVEYVRTEKDTLEFSAIFYPYCNANPNKNLFAECEIKGNTIMVKAIFNDTVVTKCLCPFRIKGKISKLGKMSYNFSIMFENKYAQHTRIIYSQVIKIEDKEKFYPETLDISVKPDLGEYLKKGKNLTKIRLESVDLKLCKLNQTCPPSKFRELVGIEISGTVKNEYSEPYYICLYALAYDSMGNIIGKSVDFGPVCGLTVLYLQANESGNFKLHVKMEWKIKQIVILVGCLSKIPPP